MKFVIPILTAMMAMPLCRAQIDTVTVTKLPEIVFEVGSSIRSALVADGGRLFFGSADGRFRAIDTATGDPLWSYTADAAVETLPVITDGRVIINAANTLYVLDAATGARIHKTIYPTGATTRVSDDHYAYNDSGVDVAKWRLDFRTELGDRVFAPMLIAGGKIYLGGRSCRMWCVDATVGTVLWSSFSADPTTWFSGGSVIVAAADVYILDGPDRRSDITAFDTRRGEVLWRTTLPDTVLSSPVIVDGTLWVASDSGRVYRFTLD